jgi:hypothetical protein
MSTINSINPKKIDLPINTKLQKSEPNKQQVNESYNKSLTEPSAIMESSSKQISEITYKKPEGFKPNTEEISRLKKISEDSLAPLKELVKQLLAEQGLSFTETEIKPTEGPMVEIDEKTRAEAQKQISDDGEYGAEKTSQRLLEMAKALSGNDKSKIDLLRTAIEDGFKEAESIWGNELPEISKKTKELTMKKMDEWQSSTETASTV